MRAIFYACILPFFLVLQGCSTFFSTYSEVLSTKRHINPVKYDPIAYAKFKQLFVSVGEVVYLDGTPSQSLSGQNLAYRWSILQRPVNSSAALIQTTHPGKMKLLIDQEGDYKIRLVVNDGEFDSRPFDLFYSTDKNSLDRVRIVAIGDAGTGSPQQRYVGQAIGSVCAEQPCDFVIGMGDNIYSSGPSSVQDQQFEDKFEKAYRGLSLPFFMVLGNHDSSGLFAGDGGFNARGQIEVEYSEHSEIWAMPDRFYQVAAPLKGVDPRNVPNVNSQPLVELFALDSTPLTSAPDLVPRYRINLYSINMGNWLSAGLHNSAAQWKLAYAHHPYISNGKHGNAGNYDSVGDYAEKLKKYMPRLNKYLFQRVAGSYYRDFFDQHMCGDLDMYLAGHDHNMQWLAPTEQCGKTHFVISGAGAKSNRINKADRNVAYWQCSETIGFFLLDIIADQMTVSIYKVDSGNGEYQLAYQARFSQRNPNKVELLQGGMDRCASI